MPKPPRSKVDELADLIFGVVQAAELAKPIGHQPAKWTPVVAEFPRSIDRAIEGVGLLDDFGRSIGGVELPVWQDGLRQALLKLKAAYLTDGHKLFGGDRAGVLHPLLKAVLRYNADLRQLHVQHAEADSIKTIVDDGAKPASATAGTDGSTGVQTVTDTPNECMYVKSPLDPKAYRPSSEIQSEATDGPSMKRLVAIIQNPANNVRWTRPLQKNGRPKMNRRSIHAGDWREYMNKQRATDSDGFPIQNAPEIEKRKAAITQSKHPGK